jgi:osmoprotectant transport system ATP-binding protein
VIIVDDVSKTYNQQSEPAVRHLSLEVGQGEFLVLLGESGSGKTTMLKMINRLVDPSEGRIIIDGGDTSLADPVQLRRNIGYVIQGIGLFPHMTVFENIGVVLTLLHWGKPAIRERVNELMELIGLPAESYAHRRPDELSGGQKQRVGFARALAARPAIMLMDEPFGALDPLTRDDVQREFLNIQRGLGLTVVMVTHDMVEALLLADRIAVMEKGRLVAVGTPHELLAHPEHPYAAALMRAPRSQAEKLEKIVRGEHA